MVQAPNGAGQTELCDAGMNGSETCYGPNNLPNGKVACTITTCGDGVVQEMNGDGITEQCDDGNMNEYDGCSSTCVSRLCELNGYVYLDKNDSNYFDRATDIVQSQIEVTLYDGTSSSTTFTNIG